MKQFHGFRRIGALGSGFSASMTGAMGDEATGTGGTTGTWSTEQAARAMAVGADPWPTGASEARERYRPKRSIKITFLSSGAALALGSALLWSISRFHPHAGGADASMGSTSARDRVGIDSLRNGDPMNLHHHAIFSVAALSAGIHGSTCGAITVRCWGSNEFGQCNVPLDVVDPIMVAAGWEHCMALLPDGTLRCWGNNDYGQCNVPGDLGPAVEIAGGIWHSVARRTDGTMRCWGWNGYGQCNVPSDLGQVVQVQGGLYHSSALRGNGTIRAWGLNDWGQCSVPSDLSGVVRYSGGPYHALAIRGDGSLACWGRNSSGQCDIPPNLGQVKRVAAGTVHSLALLADGSVRCWGSIQITDPLLGPAIDVVGGGGAGYIAFAVQTDGRVRDWENPVGQPTAPPDLTGVAQAAIGRAHFIAIADDCSLPSNNHSCCPADLFRDGLVNGADLGALLAYWGPTTSSPASQLCDIDRSGTVDGADLGALLASWGSCGG